MDKNYWLHRISHEWTHIMKACNIQARSRWNLWYFLNFKPGDIVVVPQFDKKFGIFEVLDTPFSVLQQPELSLQNKNDMDVRVGSMGLYCPKTRSYDIGFLAPVRMLNQIPRSYADSSLVSRMKIRQATADISDISKSVDDAIFRKQPVNLHTVILEQTSAKTQQVFKQYLTPNKLELVIKWYMKKKGASRVFIPPKNERGKENYADADVIAEFDDLGIIFYIQAKNHIESTSEWGVHQIKEYLQQMQDDTNGYTYISWVISTADFSEIAKEEARSKEVRLIGGDDFVKMLLNCGIEDIDDAMNP